MALPDLGNDLIGILATIRTDLRFEQVGNTLKGRNNNYDACLIVHERSDVICDERPVFRPGDGTATKLADVETIGWSPGGRIHRFRRGRMPRKCGEQRRLGQYPYAEMTLKGRILRYYYQMSSVSQTENTRSIGITDIGRVRGENQDAILADDRLRLWLVADGMGGHAGGARASTLARDVVKKQIEEGAALEDAVIAAHYAVRAEQRENPDVGDMGTTIVAVSEREPGLCDICWVGDSRAYCYSGSQDTLEMISDDHNVAGMLVASGALSPAEAARHPQRHVLTDCLGLAGDEEPRVGHVTRRWQVGEVLVLCSDGLSGELTDDEIRSILNSNQGLSEAADRLLAGALAAGAHDNVSMVLVAAPTRVGRSNGHWLWPFGRRSG